MNQPVSVVAGGICLSFALAFTPWATANQAQSAATLRQQRGYDYAHPAQQPARETPDLSMYARMRDEGLNHSHIMEYASALFDDIGPRLTGSPNLAKANAWTRDELTAMGCSQ